MAHRAHVRSLAAAAVLLATFALASPADAHALVTTSVPAAGSTVRQAPAQVVLTFTERPDAALSSIKVLDTSGQTRAGGRPTGVPGQPNQLEVAVHGLGDGVYTVTWRSVSAVDGHLASGSFAFGINVAPTGAAARSGTVNAPRPGVLAVGARWLFLLGAMGLVGGALLGLLALGTDGATVARFVLPVAWVTAVVGAIGVSLAQLSSAGLGLSDVFGSSFAHPLLLRLVPLLAAGIVLVSARRSRHLRVVFVVAALLGLLAMVGDADSSHAAAGTSWLWLKVAIQSAHFLAAGLWIGGLAALIACLPALSPERRGQVARRYSRLAGIALLVVATTGLLRAVDEVGTWHQLASTGFGQLIIVKVSLLGVLVGLGAINRYRNVKRAGRSLSGLRRVGRAEIGVAAVVLVATAVLQNLAPAKIAAANAAPAFKAVVLRGQDFATTVRVSLKVDPATAGFTQFTLKADDYDTGKPVQATTVSLAFHLPARPDVGDSTLRLVRATNGTWQASGGNLSVQGTWTITVLIQRAGGGTEIPLSLTTQTPPAKIQVQRSPGLPDFYNVTLPDGLQVQVYLDPGRTGFNQLHATYLDQSGSPLPITGLMVTQVRAGTTAPPLQLTSRRLDTGHYVADSTVQKGRYVYTFTAITADQTPITVPVTIVVH